MSANLAPVVSSISPSSGPLGGGTPVNISGNNFQPGCRVRIGGVDSPQVNFNSSNLITALAPPQTTPGTVNVRVVNPDGQAGVLTNAFNYTSTSTGQRKLTARLSELVVIDPDPDDFDAVGPVVRPLALIEEVPTDTIRAGQRSEGNLTYRLEANGVVINGVPVDVTIKGAPPPKLPTVNPNPALTGSPSKVVFETTVETPPRTYDIEIFGMPTPLEFNDLSFTNKFRLIVQPPRRRVKVEVTPEAQSIPAGAATSYNVKLKRKKVPQMVRFKTGPLPTGVTASFFPSETTANESTLTINTKSTATPADNINIEVAVEPIEEVAVIPDTVTLNIKPPRLINLTVSPTSNEVTAPATTTYNVRAASSGLTDPIGLAILGDRDDGALPRGITASFSPTTIPEPNFSTLTLQVARGVPPQTYNFRVVATSGIIREFAPVDLTVKAPPMLKLAASPRSLEVEPGGQDTSGITLEVVTFPDLVDLSLTNDLPDGVTASLNQTKLSEGDRATLTVKADASAASGRGSVTVTGKGPGGAEDSVTVEVNVVTLSGGVVLHFQRERDSLFKTERRPYQIDVKRRGGFTGAVRVKLSTTPELMPPPDPVVQVVPDTDSFAEFEVRTNDQTEARDYTITATGEALNADGTVNGSIPVTADNFFALEIKEQPETITLSFVPSSIDLRIDETKPVTLNISTNSKLGVNFRMLPLKGIRANFRSPSSATSEIVSVRADQDAALGDNKLTIEGFNNESKRGSATLTINVLPKLTQEPPPPKTKESKETKEGKDAKDKESKETKEGKEAKDKEGKETKEGKDAKDKEGKETKEFKDKERKEGKEGKEFKDGKEAKDKEGKEIKEDKEFKDGKETKDGKEAKDKERKELKEGKERKEGKENEGFGGRGFERGEFFDQPPAGADELNEQPGGGRSFIRPGERPPVGRKIINPEES